MGRLDKTVTYLAGPIDFADDLGVGFRQDIINKCRDAGLGIKFLDPTNKLPGLSKDVGEEADKINGYKKTKNWTGLRKLMKKIVRCDLRQVDLSDFLIVYVDRDVHMCGTYHELIQADLQKKPVLVIVKGGKARASAWLFGLIKPEYMFDSVDECIEFLQKVNTDSIELDDRWVIFRKDLENL